MIDLHIVLALVWLHFLADFVLQSDEVARGKSTSNKILLHHVCLYSIPFVFFGIVFALVNGVLHFVTDWYTSRVSSCFWKQEKRHAFFLVVGFDQAVHMSCLFLTYIWLVK